MFAVIIDHRFWTNSTDYRIRQHPDSEMFGGMI